MTKLELINASVMPYLKGEKPYGIKIVESAENKTTTTVCRYNNPETGACCAVGQWLKEPEKYADFFGSATMLLEKRGQDILKDEVQNILTDDEWDAVQYIHDYSVGQTSMPAIQRAIEGLEESVGKPLTEIRVLVAAQAQSVSVAKHITGEQ